MFSSVRSAEDSVSPSNGPGSPRAAGHHHLLPSPVQSHGAGRPGLDGPEPTCPLPPRRPAPESHPVAAGAAGHEPSASLSHRLSLPALLPLQDATPNCPRKRGWEGTSLPPRLSRNLMGLEARTPLRVNHPLSTGLCALRSLCSQKLQLPLPPCPGSEAKVLDTQQFVGKRIQWPPQAPWPLPHLCTTTPRARVPQQLQPLGNLKSRAPTPLQHKLHLPVP